MTTFTITSAAADHLQAPPEILARVAYLAVEVEFLHARVAALEKENTFLKATLADKVKAFEELSTANGTAKEKKTRIKKA